MLNLKKDPVLVVKICLIIIIGAFVFSFISSAFNTRAMAQTSAANDELPSFKNPEGIIPNSEDIPQIDFLGFVKELGKSTGINAFITNANKLITPSGFQFTVTGWMELVMVLVGFLVIYLGAAKGFEPLLLVPIGFGIVFANIPYAGMGE